MSDDPEILPPQKGGLPAKREERSTLPATRDEPRGVLSSLTTGFGADMAARAWSKIAKKQRAEADAYDATAELAHSKGNLARALNELDELPDTLANDSAERHHDRLQRAFVREEASKDREAETSIRAAERERRIWEAKESAAMAKRKHEAATELNERERELEKIRAATRQVEEEIRKAQHDAALQDARGMPAATAEEAHDEEYNRLVEARARALAAGDLLKAERCWRALKALEGNDGE